MAPDVLDPMKNQWFCVARIGLDREPCLPARLTPRARAGWRAWPVARACICALGGKGGVRMYDTV